MESKTTPIRLAAICSNPLVDIIMYKLPVQRSLLTILRPMEILALVRATFFCFRLTERELVVYMEWWRQAFYTIGFVERNPSTILVFSKDVLRLKSTLKRWDYFDITQIKLLVIVDESLVHEPWTVTWERRREVLRSVSTPFVWDVDLSILSGLVNTSVVFFRKRVSFELDDLWLKNLLSTNSISCKDTSPFLKADYVDLRHPDSVSQRTVSNARFAF